MRIAILGAGRMGSKLGTILARAGHQVTFSYSRHQEKLGKLADSAGHGARAALPAAAVRNAEVVLLAVHWDQVDDALHQAGDLSGKTLMSCSLPMSHDDSHLVVGYTTSGAEELAKRAKGAKVVSAFSTAPSEVLYAVYQARKRKRRPSLVFCGDDAKAKAAVHTLIKDVGFEPRDLGDLEKARFIEPFTLLIADLAYADDANPALAYRFEEFEELEE